jgi:transcriptional regulator with XRE-family HTH domain
MTVSDHASDAEEPAAHESPATLIGLKLRAARSQRQISLRELARKADISASMLSQIETGKAFPSVRSIYSIAAALGVPVDYFFPDQSATQTESAAVDAGLLTASEMRAAAASRGTGDDTPDFAAPPGAPSPVITRAQRPTIELKGGVAWARLTAAAEAGAEFLEITYAPGATSGAPMSHHEGREFGLLLAGELTVELGFETYLLRPGDSIIFDSGTPHRLSNHTAAPTRALWVVLSRP